jgi:hypothetical protein
MIRRNPLPTSRSHRLTIILLALLLLLVGWILFDRSTSQRSAQLATDNAASIAAQVRAACERRGLTAIELGDLCRQAEQIEERPAETIPGPMGERGLSCVEELGLEACRGPQGVPGIGIQGRQGDDGIPGPSCGEEFGFEACRGPRGESGESIIGPAGADSTVPGPPGPSCVDEFGLETCRGPAGSDGQDGNNGVDGADGRGIVSIEFVNGGECRMVVTYTDGTADSFDLNPSMCKVSDSEQPESP